MADIVTTLGSLRPFTGIETAWIGERVKILSLTGNMWHRVIGVVWGQGANDCHTLCELHLEGGNVFKIRRVSDRRIEIGIVHMEVEHGNSISLAQR